MKDNEAQRVIKIETHSPTPGTMKNTSAPARMINATSPLSNLHVENGMVRILKPSYIPFSTSTYCSENPSQSVQHQLARTKISKLTRGKLCVHDYLPPAQAWEDEHKVRMPVKRRAGDCDAWLGRIRGRQRRSSDCLCDVLPVSL